MELGFCWVKRRWNEFRTGHGIYLSFVLSFTNFLLIVYNLLIAKVPFLSGLLSNLWVFTVVFFVAYIPLAVWFGHYHNKTQLPADNLISTQANPLSMEMIENVRFIRKYLEEKQVG